MVAVNYGGSTGYGREFRERLREQWGIVDVRDCAAVATALAEEGTADGDRLAVRGGSAGGWTSAASLTSVKVYRCGTVMYPILDLQGWTAEGGQTHDFESRYVEGLVGVYAERTAIGTWTARPSRDPKSVSGPVLMLQGLDDQICPPVQADEFMAALDGSGIPHAYLTFEGEQHGFRKAETIRVDTRGRTVVLRPGLRIHHTWGTTAGVVGLDRCTARSPAACDQVRECGWSRRPVRSRPTCSTPVSRCCARGTWTCRSRRASRRPPRTCATSPVPTTPAPTRSRGRGATRTWTAVFCARGGYGCLRILDLLDWDAIAAARAEGVRRVQRRDRAAPQPQHPPRRQLPCSRRWSPASRSPRT